MRRSAVERVVGCGSVCLDVFHSISHFPARGSKGFISRSSPKPRVSAGGVALNALSWASFLGTPVALLASLPPPFSDDARIVRDALPRHAVSDAFVRELEARVPKSFVFTDAEERTIIMDSGPTGDLTAESVRENWGDVLRSQRNSVVFAEVSQVPLAAVAEVLSLGRGREGEGPVSRGTNPIGYLDFDVSPSGVAAAGLGHRGDVLEVLSLPDVLKTSAAVAEVLLRETLGFGSGTVPADPNAISAEFFARELHAALGGRTAVLVTDGAKGAAGCVTSLTSGTSGNVGETSFCSTQGPGTAAGDTTGAGDAFSGGILAWLHTHGAVPGSREDLLQMLKVGCGTGYACAMIEGSALPVVGAGEVGSRRLEEYRREMAEIDPGVELLMSLNGLGTENNRVREKIA